MIVLSLGGSLIVDERGINVAYLKRFVALMKREVKKGKRFLIVCGGGATARIYDRAAVAVNPRVPDVDLHWVGIYACHMNEELLRVAFGTLAEARPAEDRRRHFKARRPITIGRVGTPGMSSDGGTVQWAHAVGAKIVYNLTNVDGVFTADPRKEKSARHIPHLTWKAFFKQFGTGPWKPNAHAPFAPIAGQMAARWGISAVIINGEKLANLKRALEEKSFRGTAIGK